MFIDDVTEGRSSWANCEVYRDMLSAQIQPDASDLFVQHSTVQMGNDPIRTAEATQGFLKVKRGIIVLRPS